VATSRPQHTPHSLTAGLLEQLLKRYNNQLLSVIVL
jgi:hypothetical protein